MGTLKTIWDIVNSKLFLLFISALLTLTTAHLTNKWKQAEDTADRWEDNYSVIVRKADTLRDVNGKLIIRTQRLEMTLQEIKRSKDSTIQDMLKELKASKIRLKQVDQMLTLRQTYNKDLEMEVLNKDSLIRMLSLPESIESKPISLLVGEYKDEFTNAQILYNGKWDLKYSATNEAYGVLYHQREPVKWLLNLRVGRKDYWFDFKETNPSIKTDIRILSVEKGRR